MRCAERAGNPSAVLQAAAGHRQPSLHGSTVCPDSKWGGEFYRQVSNSAQSFVYLQLTSPARAREIHTALQINTRGI